MDNCCKCGRKFGAKIRYHQKVSYTTLNKNGEYIDKFGELCGACLYNLLNDPTRTPNQYAYYRLTDDFGNVYDESQLEQLEFIF